MRLYTFYLCDEDGFSASFETRELPFDSASFPVAGDLLDRHLSADHVAVWDEDRPVLSRYRDGMELRGVVSPRGERVGQEA